MATFGQSASSGAIVQIQSTIVTSAVDLGTYSGTTVSFSDVTGMTCNITPQTGNHVLVNINSNWGPEEDYNYSIRVARVKGATTTAMFVGDASGDRARATFHFRGDLDRGQYGIVNHSGMFLDTSPGGDGSTAITYKLQWSGDNNGDLFLNLAETGGDAYQYATTSSTITLMEIIA